MELVICRSILNCSCNNASIWARKRCGLCLFRCYKLLITVIFRLLMQICRARYWIGTSSLRMSFSQILHALSLVTSGWVDNYRKISWLRLTLEHHCTWLLNCSTRSLMMRKSIFGLWGVFCMKCVHWQLLLQLQTWSLWSWKCLLGRGMHSQLLFLKTWSKLSIWCCNRSQQRGPAHVN